MPQFSNIGIKLHTQISARPEFNSVHNFQEPEKQCNNFFNVKLATIEFSEGDFRDNLSPPTSPKYYAIKSHIRHFYYPPDQDDLESGEFIQVHFARLLDLP